MVALPLAVLGNTVSVEELEANTPTRLPHPFLSSFCCMKAEVRRELGAGPVHRGQGAGVRVQGQYAGPRVQAQCTGYKALVALVALAWSTVSSEYDFLGGLNFSKVSGAC